MATSIHGLAFIASVDTKQLEKGMVLTRKELRSARDITEKYKSSAERLAETQAKLNRLVESGKITRDMANKEMQEAIALQDRLNKKQKEGDKAAASAAKAGSAASAGGFGLIGGLGVRALGVVGGAVTAAKVVGAVTNEMERLDRLGNLAERLSLPVESLQRIAFVTDRFGQIDAEGTASSLVTMTKAISDSAAGVGKAKRFFEQFGVDAAKLNQLTVDQKFLAMADAARSIANEGDRLSFVKAIFGDEAMVQVLSKSNAELETMMGRLDKLGGVATIKEVDAIANAADAWQEAGISWAVVTKELAIAAAPLGKIAADLSKTFADNIAVGVKEGPSAWLDFVEAFSDKGPLGFRGRMTELSIDRLNRQGNLPQLPTGIVPGANTEADLDRLLAEMPNRGVQLRAQRDAVDRELAEKSVEIQKYQLDELTLHRQHLARIEEITRQNQERIEQWKREGR